MRKIALSLLLSLSLLSPLDTLADTSLLTLQIPEESFDESLVIPQFGELADEPTFTVSIAPLGPDVGAQPATPFSQAFDGQALILNVQVPTALLNIPLLVMISGGGIAAPMAAIRMIFGVPRSRPGAHSGDRRSVQRRVGRHTGNASC